MYYTIDNNDIICEIWHSTHKSKHLHDRIISLRWEVWAHKTSLPPHFLLKCLYQTRNVSGHVFVSEWTCICEWGGMYLWGSGHVFVSEWACICEWVGMYLWVSGHVLVSEWACICEWVGMYLWVSGHLFVSEGYLFCFFLRFWFWT
jgi:hypothetical protein